MLEVIASRFHISIMVLFKLIRLVWNHFKDGSKERNLRVINLENVLNTWYPRPPDHWPDNILNETSFDFNPIIFVNQWRFYQIKIYVTSRYLTYQDDLPGIDQDSLDDYWQFWRLTILLRENYIHPRSKYCIKYLSCQ